MPLYNTNYDSKRQTYNGSRLCKILAPLPRQTAYVAQPHLDTEETTEHEDSQKLLAPVEKIITINDGLLIRFWFATLSSSLCTHACVMEAQLRLRLSFDALNFLFITNTLTPALSYIVTIGRHETAEPLEVIFEHHLQ